MLARIGLTNGWRRPPKTSTDVRLCQAAVASMEQKRSVKSKTSTWGNASLPVTDAKAQPIPSGIVTHDCGYKRPKRLTTWPDPTKQTEPSCRVYRRLRRPRRPSPSLTTTYPFLQQKPFLQQTARIFATNRICATKPTFPLEGKGLLLRSR